MANDKRKPINKPVVHDPRTLVCFAIPGGSDSLYLTPEQLHEYNADPDLYVANCLGLHIEDYRDYIELDGAPGCAATSKSGKYCRNTIGAVQQPLERWLLLHRNVLCHVHSDKGSV